MSKLARTRLRVLLPALLFTLAIAAACATSEDERAPTGSGGARAAGGSLGRGGRAGSGATGGAGGSAGVFGSSDGSLDRAADESDDARPESGSEAAGDVGAEARLDAITETLADAAQETDGVSTSDSSGDSGAGSDRCPGQDLVLSGTPRAASVSGDSTSLTADYSATCGGGPGRDVVYHLVTPQSGLLTFTLTPNGFDAVLYVRVGPCATGTPVCKNLAAAGGAETLQLSAGSGIELSVFVDSDAGEGPFTLSVSY